MSKDQMYMMARIRRGDVLCMIATQAFLGSLFVSWQDMIFNRP